MHLPKKLLYIVMIMFFAIIFMMYEIKNINQIEKNTANWIKLEISSTTTFRHISRERLHQNFSKIPRNSKTIFTPKHDEQMPTSLVNSTKNGILQELRQISKPNNELLESKRPSLNLNKKFEVPEETLDPHSRYYRMIYKDTYGLPLSEFGLSSMEAGYPDWTQYYPDLMKSLKQYKLKNPSQDPDRYTRNYTSVLTTRKSNVYKVGDTLITHIQAKDRLNRLKTFGGDYFRARLIRKGMDGKVIDGIPGKIQDHMNGSYTVEVPLLLTGVMTLEVKLISSVEAINEWINFTEIPNHKGNSYIGVLKTGERVECNLHLNTFEKYQGKELCDYSNPRNGEPWFCAMPPSGVCSQITYIDLHPLSSQPPFQVYFYVQDVYGIQGEILGSGVKIKVQMPQNNFDLTVYIKEQRIDSWLSGFYQGKSWISWQQNNLLPSCESARKCFQDKVIYAFGDSTIHQYFFSMRETFRLIVHGVDNSTHKQCPKMQVKEKDNITAYYRTHGSPLHGVGPPTDRPYISDSIDTIPVGGSDVYVIFNIALHILYYHPGLCMNRLIGIREAIIRHLRKYPDTKFVLKGLNITEWPQEWLIKRFDIFFRKIFKDIKNVWFMNLWDYTTVLPLPEYHPRDSQMQQEALLFYSAVCNWPL